MSGAGLSPAQQRAKAAEAMAFERAHRSLSARERHAAWLEEREAVHVDETRLASDWLLARVPALLTPSGFACGFAVMAVKGLRRERPELAGADLLAAVLAFRDERLRAIGAEDLIVPGPTAEAVAA